MRRVFQQGSMGAWVLGLMLILGTQACQFATPDDVMRMTLARGTPEEEVVSDQLANLALSSEQPLEVRMWALRALGRLEKHPLTTLSGLGEVVANGRCPDVWRSFAAWTLGQMHRKEVVPYLIQALSTPLSTSSSYYVLEALGANLKFLLDDLELNQKAIGSLHHFASIQSQLIGNMYELVNEYLSNLVVLAVALESAQKRAWAPGSTAAQRDELYVSTQRTLQHLLTNKSRYMAAFAEKQGQLQRVLDLALAEATTHDVPIWLLTAWHVAALTDNAEFSGLVVRRLVEWLPKSPPSVKLVLIWALARSERFSETARKALLEGVMCTETDPTVLELLARMSSTSNTLDLFQKTLGLNPAAQTPGGTP